MEVAVEAQVEGLLDTITGSGVEIIGKRGRTFEGDTDLEKHFDNVGNIARLGEKTQMVLAETDDPNKTLLCISYVAKKTDKFDRIASLRVILAMTTSNANAFKNLAISNPDAVFKAVKKAHGNIAPTNYYGESSEVAVEGTVKIMPNIKVDDTYSSYRAKVDQITSSAPFPKGYKPW